MGLTETIVCDICNQPIDPAVNKVRRIVVGTTLYILSDNCKDTPNFAANVATLTTALVAAFKADLQRLNTELGI
jgi:hypothetical protein